MTDEPDGDRPDDPSDDTSEEDPFIYPLDDAETGDADGSTTDDDASAAGEDASTGGEASTTGDEGSRGGFDGSARGTAGSTAAGSAAGGESSSSGTGASTSGTGGTSRDTGASGTGASSGSSSARASRSTTDVGAHATDRRPHASESGRTHPSRDRSAGAASAGQRGSPGSARGHRRGQSSASETGPSGVGGWVRWFWTTDEGAAIYVRDVLTSVMAVLVVGLVLFAISGIWPPMVAVESGSMEPNMQVGDLVFIVDNERYTPEGAQEYDGQSTGVVPADHAEETGRSKFGGPGDVIVFKPNGQGGTTPVIHRAMLWVEADENWYDRADPDAVGTASDCEELNHCPAPHAGFITRGDANPRYDQQTTLSAPVRPEWIVGTAELRIPYLGHIRLAFSGQLAPELDAGFADPAAADRGAPTVDERTGHAPEWDETAATGGDHATLRSTASSPTSSTSNTTLRPTATGAAARPVA